MAVAGVSKTQTQHLGIVARLLHAILRGSKAGLRLDNCNRVIGPIAQDVVSALLLAAAWLATDEHHATIGESTLFLDRTRRIVPAGSLQAGDNQLATGICFCDHDLTDVVPGTSDNGKLMMWRSPAFPG